MTLPVLKICDEFFFTPGPLEKNINIFNALIYAEIVTLEVI